MRTTAAMNMSCIGMGTTSASEMSCIAGVSTATTVSKKIGS